MKLFDVLPEELFSVLASPNRALYADALEVLYTAYRENLRMPEQTLFTMLRNRLEEELLAANFDDEDIYEEELSDLSGRARFIIRKLCAKGWFEKVRGEQFDVYITVPGYSSRLLEVLHQLREDTPARGYSYVFGTYSTLKVAGEGDSVYDKMAAVYSAYDNTRALIDVLQMVYHNVRHFFKLQVEMQDLNEVLASHFDDFGQRVVEAYIRPLKIKDSVPKYRVPIQSIISEWLGDEELLTAMAQQAVQDRRGETVEACRGDLMKKMFWIKDRYDTMEHEYLDAIDSQVRRYTRATTQKIENLTNRDRSVKGNLNVVLQALADEDKGSMELTDKLSDVFSLYEQQFISEKSLWLRKRIEKRERTAPVVIEEGNQISDAALEKAKELLQTEYGRVAVFNHIKDLLGDSGEFYAKDIGLYEDKDYIMSLLTVLYSKEKVAPHKVQILDGDYKENGYTIPQMKVTRR